MTFKSRHFNHLITAFFLDDILASGVHPAVHEAINEIATLGRVLHIGFTLFFGNFVALARSHGTLKYQAFFFTLLAMIGNWNFPLNL